MTNKWLKQMTWLTCLSIGLLGVSSTGQAEEANSQDATVKIQRSKTGISAIQDPENPDTVVDPGESPRTDGDLRIDFVPRLSFNTVTVDGKDLNLPVDAQLFHSAGLPRGNFIQVTDEREEFTGWKLQLKQENQFMHTEKEGVQLKGATISFDQAWTNSQIDSQYAPLVKKEVIQMSAIGEAYDLAVAESGKGMSTWSIVFGASTENQNSQSPTLAARTDEQGSPVMDATFNQPSYANSAVNLTIPGQTTKEPGKYTTVLTWILAELP